MNAESENGARLDVKLLSDNSSRVWGRRDETLWHNTPNLSRMLHYAYFALLNLQNFKSSKIAQHPKFLTISSLQVNISNTWTLPQPGFNVFYRHFRDKISWFEADAVCQFHHANLVTGNLADKLFMTFSGRCQCGDSRPGNFNWLVAILHRISLTLWHRIKMSLGWKLFLVHLIPSPLFDFNQLRIRVD